MRKELQVTAVADAATVVEKVEFPETVSAVHFVRLELLDGAGKLVSENFYWRALKDRRDDLNELDGLAKVKVETNVVRRDVGGNCLLTVTLHNATGKIALMTHLQLRHGESAQRVLPVFYSDNYVSLIPGETRVVTIEADLRDLKGEAAVVAVDGWNVDVQSRKFVGVSVGNNVDADVSHSPVTGLPFQTEGLR
jgi:hypothetical protein